MTKNPAKLPLPPCFSAICNELSPLLYQVLAAGNGVVSRVQKFLGFFGECLAHLALLGRAGGSAIGLSATGAHGWPLASDGE